MRPNILGTYVIFLQLMGSCWQLTIKKLTKAYCIIPLRSETNVWPHESQGAVVVISCKHTKTVSWLVPYQKKEAFKICQIFSEYYSCSVSHMEIARDRVLKTSFSLMDTTRNYLCVCLSQDLPVILSGSVRLWAVCHRKVREPILKPDISIAVACAFQHG